MKIRLLFLLWLLFYSSAYSDSKPIIMVLGDSLSSAYGLAVDQGWVSLLQQRLRQKGYPHQIVNASASGDTTANGLTRLPTALRKHRPDVVIVELGGNDGLRAQPVDLIRDNLNSIIKAIQSDGAQVVLAGMRLPPNYGPAYVKAFEKIYPELAARYEVVLIPFFMEGVATVTELMQNDGVHPGAAAQPILLDNVWPYLQPLLKSTLR